MPNSATLLDDRAQLLKKIRKLQQSKDHLEALVQTGNLDSILEGVIYPALRFVRGHLRNARRPGTARRWEQHDKVLYLFSNSLYSLSVFKRSPRAYSLLCMFLCLPSVRTLLRVLENVRMEPGIDKHVLEMMHRLGNKMSDQERFCTLMFDEMSLKKKRLLYNDKKGLIDGYVDYGTQGRSNNVADHALVLMIQGLQRPYKQPVAYYFSKHSAPADGAAETPSFSQVRGKVRSFLPFFFVGGTQDLCVT